MSTFPTGRKDRIREREKLEKLIAQIEGWEDGLMHFRDEAARELSKPQHRVTNASAQRREDAKADIRLANEAMHNLGFARANLRSFLANPLTQPKPLAKDADAE